MGMAYADMFNLQYIPGREEMQISQIEEEGPVPVFHFQIDTGIAARAVHQQAIKHDELAKRLKFGHFRRLRKKDPQARRANPEE
jgi:hypothetical protein